MKPNPIQRVFLLVAVLGIGYFAAPLVRELFPSDGDWQEQVRRDAATAVDVLAPEVPADLAEIDGFWEAWDARLGLYDDTHRAELRAALHVYVDALEAEWADVAEIYAVAADTRTPSASVRERREALRETFGPVADAWLADLDRLRSRAYAASPAHSGLDPDLPDYGELSLAVREWLPMARERADLLTTPPGER